MLGAWHGAWVTVNHKQIISYKQACWLLPTAKHCCLRSLPPPKRGPYQRAAAAVRALPHAGIVGLRPWGGRGVAAVGRHGFRGAHTQPALRRGSSGRPGLGRRVATALHLVFLHRLGGLSERGPKVRGLHSVEEVIGSRTGGASFSPRGPLSCAHVPISQMQHRVADRAGL